MNHVDLDLNDDEDPDSLDAAHLQLVMDAAALLRAAEPDSDDAVERTLERLRGEAGLSTLLRSVGGAFGRVARAAPDLLGPPA